METFIIETITEMKIVLIITTILSAFCMVFATGPDIPSGSKPGSGADEVTNITNMVIYVIQIIAFAVAVIIVIWAGVKYMGAAPEAKAEFKKKLIYMTIGAVILFAAGSLVKLIGGLAMNNI